MNLDKKEFSLVKISLGNINVIVYKKEIELYEFCWERLFWLSVLFLWHNIK